MNCIFCKIINKQIQSTMVFEDEDVIAINDIRPKKPVHILVIPKNHVEEFQKVDDKVLKDIKNVLHKLIVERGLSDKGYRIEINGGGFQEVDHLHFHLMGPMGKSP